MTLLKWLAFAVLGLILIVGVVALVGFALPQDHVASRTATFNRPAGEVWTTITDVPSFPSWRQSVTRVEVLNREPLRWREDGPDGPLTLQVVEWKPPHRLVTEIADRNLPFGGRWVYELAPAGAGTQLTITEQGEVYNPIFRFVSRFVIGHTATLDAYLAALHAKLG